MITIPRFSSAPLACAFATLVSVTAAPLTAQINTVQQVANLTFYRRNNSLLTSSPIACIAPPQVQTHCSAGNS